MGKYAKFLFLEGKERIKNLTETTQVQYNRNTEKKSLSEERRRKV